MAAGAIERTSSNMSSEEGKIDDAGFVAFNADYHEPRHHPPKNN